MLEWFIIGFTAYFITTLIVFLAMLGLANSMKMRTGVHQKMSEEHKIWYIFLAAWAWPAYSYHAIRVIIRAMKYHV